MEIQENKKTWTTLHHYPHVSICTWYLRSFIHGDKSNRYTCKNCKKEGIFSKSKYLKTFPKYLIVQLTNFALNGWAPKKLHCDVQLGDLSNIVFERLKAPELPSDAVNCAYSGGSEIRRERWESPRGPRSTRTAAKHGIQWEQMQESAHGDRKQCRQCSQHDIL